MNYRCSYSLLSHGSYAAMPRREDDDDDSEAEGPAGRRIEDVLIGYKAQANNLQDSKRAEAMEKLRDEQVSVWLCTGVFNAQQTTASCALWLKDDSDASKLKAVTDGLIKIGLTVGGMRAPKNRSEGRFPLLEIILPADCPIKKEWLATKAESDVKTGKTTAATSAAQFDSVMVNGWISRNFKNYKKGIESADQLLAKKNSLDALQQLEVLEEQYARAGHAGDIDKSTADLTDLQTQLASARGDVPKAQDIAVRIRHATEQSVAAHNALSRALGKIKVRFTTMRELRKIIDSAAITASNKRKRKSNSTLNPRKESRLAEHGPVAAAAAAAGVLAAVNGAEVPVEAAVAVVVEAVVVALDVAGGATEVAPQHAAGMGFV